MKKSKKEIVKIAKILYKASFTDSKLDRNKILRYSGNIKKTFKSNAYQIFKSYLDLIDSYQARETIMIESVNQLSPKDLEELKTYFARKYEKPLLASVGRDQRLIGGLRVTVGDDQYDFSLKNQLNQLKEALGG